MVTLIAERRHFRNQTPAVTRQNSSMAMVTYQSMEGDRYEPPPVSAQQQKPQFGAQITVTTESEKRERKEQRKLQKRIRKNGEEFQDDQDQAVDFETLRMAHEQTLIENAERPLFSSEYRTPKGPQLPYVFHSGQQADGVYVPIYGARYALPAGTERRDCQEFEEISIPITQPAPPLLQEKSIGIDDLPSWMRPVFKGYQQLNRIQSIICPVALSTRENMLVCAPTGAGKTDVAMLAVLSTINQYRVVSETNRGE
jgi:hypothetical protein